MIHLKGSVIYVAKPYLFSYAHMHAHTHGVLSHQSVQISMHISSHCLHCHSVLAGEREVCTVGRLCNFTHERRRQRQTSEHPKSPFLHLSEPYSRPTPLTSSAEGEKKNQQSTFIFAQNYNLTLKSSGLKL